MTSDPRASILALGLLGLGTGLVSGVFGIGGGILLVPALVYLLDYPSQRAIGTSLAVLLPPVGLAAVLEYNAHGNVDVRAAAVIAVTLFVGAWGGASLANTFEPARVKLLFGAFCVLVGLYTVFEALADMARRRA
jgi:uncharacterized membrane protein YfcA